MRVVASLAFVAFVIVGATAVSAADAPCPNTAKPPKVVRVANTPPTDPGRATNDIAVTTDVYITVEGADALVECSATLQKPIVLSVDDLAIPSVTATPEKLAGGSGNVVLHFIPQAANVTDRAALWRRLVQGHITESLVSSLVSVGVEGLTTFFVTPKTMNVFAFNGEFWVAVGAAALIALFAMLVGAKTDALRVAPSPTHDAEFSLARVQIALWSAIVAMAWVYLSLRTGGFAEIPAGVLVLLGISATTTASGSVITGNQDSAAAAASPGGALPAAPTSSGLVTDVLTDYAGGVSVHRYQFALFTVIFAVAFLVQVVTTCAMPIFDTSLLVLMGISSGTYLGLKNNERVPDASSPAPVAPAAGTPVLGTPPPVVPR